MNLSDIKITRKELNIIAKNRGIEDPHKISTNDLMNTLIRHDKKRKSYNIRRKINKLNLKKIGKKQNITIKELHKLLKLHDKSLDDLKKIAKFWRIKNYDNLSKEDLTYTLLKSGKNPLEDNYLNYINNVTDDRIKGKINYIRLALIKLGYILTKNDRKKIKEELYVIENRQNLTNAQKDRIYNHLIETATTLDKIEANKYHNYDDLD